MTASYFDENELTSGEASKAAIESAMASKVACAMPRPTSSRCTGCGSADAAGDRRGIELGNRPGEAGVRHVAERASLISVDGQLLVVNQELAEKDGAERRTRQTLAQLRQRLRLDPIDLGYDAINLSFHRRRKR